MCVAAAVLAMTLIVLIAYDEVILRAYWNLDLPWWLYRVEHAFSTWIHRTVLVTGIVLLAIGLPRHRWHVALAMGGQFVIVQALKAALGRVRPCDVVDPSLWLGPTMLHDAFPSGHATAIWTMTFVLVRRFPREAPFLVPLALGVCWARIHASAHYPSDLLAGFALAWLVDQVAWRFAVKWGSRDEHDRATARGLFVGTCPVRTALWTLLMALAITMSGVWMLRQSVSPASIAQAQAEVIITDLYRRILKREPDAPGLAAHAAKLVDEDLPIVRLREIAISPENTQRVMQLEDDQAQVADVYQSLLRRDPTPREMDEALHLFGEYDDEYRAWALRLIMTRIFHGIETVPVRD